MPHSRFLFHPATYGCLSSCKGKDTCGSAIDICGFNVSGSGGDGQGRGNCYNPANGLAGAYGRGADCPVPRGSRPATSGTVHQRAVSAAPRKVGTLVLVSH